MINLFHCDFAIRGGEFQEACYLLCRRSNGRFRRRVRSGWDHSDVVASGRACELVLTRFCMKGDEAWFASRHVNRNAPTFVFMMETYCAPSLNPDEVHLVWPVFLSRATMNFSPPGVPRTRLPSISTDSL